MSQLKFEEFQRCSPNGTMQIENLYLNKILDKFSFYRLPEGDIKINNIFQKNEQGIIIIDTLNTIEKPTPTDIIICFDYKLLIFHFSQKPLLFSFLSQNKTFKIYCISTYIKSFLITMVKSSQLILNIQDNEKEENIFKQEINNFIKNSNIIFNNVNQSNYWKPIFRCIFGFLIQKARLNSKSDRIINFLSFFSNEVQEEMFTEEELIELRLIGYGRSSHVLLYYSLIKEKVFAIKIIIIKKEEETKKIFERERRNYMNIHHPLFLKYFGTTKIGSFQYCLVLEYIEGKTMDKIDFKYLSREAEIKMIFQMMLIIEYLHYNEYVYRDLKPDNFMIDEKYSVYLIDLGRMRKTNENSDDQFTQLFSIYFNENIASIDPLSQMIDISSLEKIIKTFFSTDFGVKYSEHLQRLEKTKPNNNQLMISLLFDAFYSEYFSKIRAINEFYSLQTGRNIMFHNDLFFPFWFLMSEYQNSEAQLQLGYCCEKCFMISKNENKNIQFSKFDSNESGLGNIFNSHKVIFTKVDFNRAIYYYTLSANQNNVEAQYMLGTIYDSSKSVNHDVKKAIYYLTLAANQNHSQAQYRLGQIYFFNIHIPPDIPKAIYYFRLVADQNNCEAQYFLGMIYMKEPQFRDINKGIHYLTLSANQNFSEAQLELAFIYEEGRYVSRNINKAISYYEKSAKQNNSTALNSLGLLYNEGFYVKKDIEKAIHYFSQAAQLKNKDALFNLALFYIEGKYVKYDINKGIQYLTLAAEQGLIIAQFYLGIIYQGEKYVKRDIQKAIYYYTLAAKQNDAKSQHNLGHIYYEGKYVPRDINKSIYYWQLAADQKLVNSYNILAHIFYHGLYIAKDINKAIHYLTLAAQQNDSNAQCNLGNLYYDDKNVPCDIEKAIYYLQLSASQKNKKALYILGNIYENGKYVNRDIEKALYYYQSSANQYYPDALLSLGYIYISGKYVPVDINKAMHYYQLAVNQNNKIALFNLAQIYYYNSFGKKDVKKAICYYKMSAEKGDIFSNFKIGFVYHEGKYVERDVQKAIHYYKNASSFNFQYAKNNLGILYEFGFGNEIPKKPGLAIEYFKEAINQNNDPIAMFNLAQFYLFNGSTINDNIDKSIELLIKSSIHGFENSKCLLSFVLFSKFSNDSVKMKNEIIKYTEQTSKLPFEICKIIEQLHLSLYYDSLFQKYREVYYLYDASFNPFLGSEIIEQKKIETPNTNKHIRKINDLFYEGLGLFTKLETL